MQCDSDGPVNTFADAGSHSQFTVALYYSREAGERGRRARWGRDGVGGAIACGGVAQTRHREVLEIA